MSTEELNSAGISDEGWRAARMLGYTFIAGLIIYIPIAVLTAVYFGFKVVDYAFSR